MLDKETVEAAAKKYAQSEMKDFGLRSGTEWYDRVYNVFYKHHIAICNATQPVAKSHWIDVKDGLPEDTGWYLVFTNDKVIMTAAVASNGWWRTIMGAHYSDLGPDFIENSKRTERQVTHWQPLPSPPNS